MRVQVTISTWHCRVMLCHVMSCRFVQCHDVGEDTTRLVSLTTSLVEDLEISTSGLKGVPLLDSHLTEGERESVEGSGREGR